MEVEDFSKDIILAKKAALESGKLLKDKKKEINKILNSDRKDTKLMADIESENLIKSIIVSESNYPILAEESGKSLDDLGDIFWVIDPLDGTAIYNRDIPVCCVSIGLVKDMKPLFGVIYDFNNDDIFLGDKFSNTSKMNDITINVSQKSDKKESILITGLPHNTDYSDSSLKNIIKDMQDWKKIRMIGSAAMAACYVASGKAERYQESGIYLWDIIAGAAIVESAGGSAEILNIRENFQVDAIFSNSKIK